MNQDKEFEWNDGCWVELLDRLNTIMIMQQELLVNHPGVLRAGISEKIDDLMGDTMQCYQIVGESSFLEDEGCRTIHQVMKLLVDWLIVDNYVIFKFNQEHVEKARPHIFTMLMCGYFKDDPTHLESSFAKAAIGGHDESIEYFSACPGVYTKLSEVLNDIFENHIDDEATNQLYPVMEPLQVGNI